jgi:uncharacterized RDD family membrane protein YckC
MTMMCFDPTGNHPLSDNPTSFTTIADAVLLSSRAIQINGEIRLYFRAEDYAAIWRRFLVDVIDLLTVGLICVVLTAGLGGVVPNNLLLWCWITMFFCYFVLLKKSFSTLGYRVAGVRIVGLNGQSPSVWNLTVRTTFMFLGPLNYLVDLVWLSRDPHRQAIRDKVAGTYVVRRKAVPIGAGKVMRHQYSMLGCNFLCSEIMTQSEVKAAQ